MFLLVDVFQHPSMHSFLIILSGQPCRYSYNKKNMTVEDGSDFVISSEISEVRAIYFFQDEKNNKFF